MILPRVDHVQLSAFSRPLLRDLSNLRKTRRMRRRGRKMARRTVMMTTRKWSRRTEYFLVKDRKLKM